MSNPSMVGRVKIGRTSKDPKANRLRELSADTAAAEPFHLEYYCYVEDYERLETLVHSELAHVRPNKNREFFVITPVEAMRIIQKVAPNCGGIKFDEQSFSQNLISGIDSSTSDDYHEISESHEISDLIEAYPKARKVMEYSDLASKLYRELENFPDTVKEEFLIFLENQPNIRDEELSKIFNDVFLKVYKKPFADEHTNNLYALCLEHSQQMAEEFVYVAKLRGNAISSDDLFQKLSKKYGWLKANIEQRNIREFGKSKFEKFMYNLGTKLR